MPTTLEKMGFHTRAFGFECRAQSQRVFNRHGVVIFGVEEEMGGRTIRNISIRRMGGLHRRCRGGAQQLQA